MACSPTTATTRSATVARAPVEAVVKMARRAAAAVALVKFTAQALTRPAAPIDTSDRADSARTAAVLHVPVPVPCPYPFRTRARHSLRMLAARVVTNVLRGQCR